ncbi:MAG: hypothetical protein WCO42_11580 [bacterium]|jgi:hypothetical protein|nr:hypothetical protein [Verrucomicrobiota bacterium]
MTSQQILGGQSPNVTSDEWRGVQGKPRTLMCAAIPVLIVAALIIACGNTHAEA